MSRRCLLIVDDDPGIVRGLRWAFPDYEVVTAGDRAEALAAVREHGPQVVTLDLGLPPAPDEATEGLAALDEILATAPRTKVILVTGNEDRRNALLAIQRGAYDYCPKPIDADVLSVVVARAFHLWGLESELRQMQEAASAPLHGIVTCDPGMVAACRMVEKVAPTGANVLILGESGTGKELVARALHRAGRNPSGPFIAINCAAIPETLLESELFGHEKGAFTGAVKQVKGKVELAQDGTLLLDEIGDMPAALQAKLLRFLQERVIERVGGRQPIPVSCRVLCATHRDLERLAQEGQFRQDLYFRISEITLEIPPLRERGDDVILLANHFATRMAPELGKPLPRITPDAAALLRRYEWPGNVRELENRMRRAIVLAEGDRLEPNDFGLAPPAGPQQAAATAASGARTLKEARDQAELDALRSALTEAQGNISVVAKLLDVSRPTVYALVRQHGLDPAAFVGRPG